MIMSEEQRARAAPIASAPTSLRDSAFALEVLPIAFAREFELPRGGRP